MITLNGARELVDVTERMRGVFRPGGEMSNAVRHMTTGALSGLKARTHVDTGAYRNAQMMQMESALEGRVFIDPAARNPRSGVPVVVYGPIEEKRAGSHAAYQRTYTEQGDALVREAGEMLVRAFE